jgi:hypothetical protein
MEHNQPKTLLTAFGNINLLENLIEFTLSPQYVFIPPPTEVFERIGFLLEIMHLPHDQSSSESLLGGMHLPHDQSFRESLLEVMSFFMGLLPSHEKFSLSIDSFNDTSSSDKLLLRINLSYKGTKFTFLFRMPPSSIDSFNQKNSSSQEPLFNQNDNFFYNSIKKLKSLSEETILILPSDISSITYQSIYKIAPPFSKSFRELIFFLKISFPDLDESSFIIIPPSNSSYLSGLRFLSGESFLGLHSPSDQYFSRMTVPLTEHFLRRAITHFFNFIYSVNNDIISMENNPNIESRSISLKTIFEIFSRSLYFLSKHPKISQNDSLFLDKLKYLFSLPNIIDPMESIHQSILSNYSFLTCIDTNHIQIAKEIKLPKDHNEFDSVSIFLYELNDALKDYSYHLHYQKS